MIIEMMMDRIFFFVDLLLSGMPLLQISIPVDAISNVFDFFAKAAYFLPIDTVLIIASILIAEEGFKISMSIIKFVLRFVPFVDGGN